MNTLIILSILIGHLWADRAQASDVAKQTLAGATTEKHKPNPVAKGLISNAATPKVKEQFSKDIHTFPGHKAVNASASSTQSSKKPESVQKLIPLEPSKKIDAPVEQKQAPIKDVKSKLIDESTSIKEPSAAESKAAGAPKETESKNSQLQEDAKLEVSIDTVGAEAGGNWLSKRVWYEHAQNALQDIANELSNILATRQQYLTARDSLDDTLEEAFIELGFDQGKLSQLLEELLESLKEEQKERGDLSEGERTLRHKIETQQKDLEQLRLDLESLKNLDDSLDGAVKRVMEQINLAGMYNKEAHSYFDQIPNVHEQHAKELYYKIDTLNKDMIAIKAYLTGQLLEYLGQIENSTTMHIAKIKSEIAAIQAKGLDFKKQLRVMEGQDKEVVERREAEQEESEQGAGFFDRIWDWIIGWF